LKKRDHINSNLAHKSNFYVNPLFIGNTTNSAETLDLLKQFFPNILDTNTNKECIEKYINQNNMINLIITDIDKCFKSGLNMLREIKKKNSKILIIIISSYSDSDYLLEAINIGICNYLIKPLTVSQVEKAHNSLLEYYFSNKDIVRLQNNFLWDVFGFSLKYKNENVHLTKNEIKLIDFLLSSNQNFKSNYAIEDFIFDDLLCNNKRVRNLVSRLNNKLEINLIESTYAQGYKIAKYVEE